MTPKAPVLLVVQVETAQLRWYVAAIDRAGQLTPLLCSEVGDLEKYKGLAFDEQVVFLRHRFCGVLQRGCDRLWARDMKASQFVFIFDEPLPEPTGELTPRVAEHFAIWMLNPPAAVFVGANEAGLVRIAGEIDRPLADLLNARLADLARLREDPTAWEPSRR